MAQETVDKLDDTNRSILRAIDDGYRGVIAEVTATPLLGIDTRRQATQDAMSRFAKRGITTFRDRSGRRWSMTAYAEMAVRTSVGRAAIEAHTRTLSTAGVNLVIVSDSPRECPLCRPWERQVLTIDGPARASTIQAEHATQDGVMIPVHVAGSLDQARAAGLQHPNCRHSVSAYTPGITKVDNATSDPDGYEAGQRQRAIERNIRRWKNEQAASITPEAKRAAGAKVRQWQGVMRQHLADNPDLRRNRTREQPGAGNLPVQTTAPAAEHVDAARIMSGDDASVRAMSDEQLAAAMRSNALDARARARLETEADRRDTEQLLARATPRGQLTAYLTQFSDDELGRVLPHVDDRDTLRIATELDRATSPHACPVSGPSLSDCLTTSSPSAYATPSRTARTT